MDLSVAVVKVARFLVWLAMSLPLFSAGARGGSDLIFPRLSFGDDDLTGLAIVNPRDLEAVVTLTVYAADGKLLVSEGFNNPVEITIGAGQQFAQVATAVFGSGVATEQIAWIHAASGTNDLAGFFLFLTASLDVFDGADLPETADMLVFNEVRISGGFQTELNLVNPNPEEASVTLSLLGAGEPVTKELKIAGQGAARLEALEFFNPTGAQLGGNSPLYVTASANMEIAGFEFVRGSGDILGLNARPAEEMLDTLSCEISGCDHEK